MQEEVTRKVALDQDSVLSRRTQSIRNTLNSVRPSIVETVIGIPKKRREAAALPLEQLPVYALVNQQVEDLINFQLVKRLEPMVETVLNAQTDYASLPQETLRNAESTQANNLQSRLFKATVESLKALESRMTPREEAMNATIDQLRKELVTLKSELRSFRAEAVNSGCPRKKKKKNPKQSKPTASAPGQAQASRPTPSAPPSRIKSGRGGRGRKAKVSSKNMQ